MTPDELKARYPRAFAYLRARNVVLSDAFYAELEQVRSRSWTIAKLATIEQIEQVKSSLEDALSKGLSFHEWQKTVTPEMLAQPRHYRELVYRNSVLSAHNAAKWAHFRDNAERRPILRYSAVNDSRTRPSHRALHGLMMPIDDPRWATISPQNGHNCRCTLMSLSERQAKAFGYKGTPERLPTYKDKHGHEHTATPDSGWAHSPEIDHLTDMLRERERKAGVSRAVFDSSSSRNRQPIDGWPPEPIVGDIESEARHYVVSNGQKDNVEYAVIAVGSEILVRRRGEKVAVEFTKQELDTLSGRGATLYHNHPSSSSLSQKDIQFVTDYGLAAIVAYGTYEASEYHIAIRKPAMSVKAALFDVYEQLNRLLSKAVRTSEISAQEATHIRPHIANIALEKKEFIQYTISNLDSYSVAIMNNHQQLFNRIIGKIK